MTSARQSRRTIAGGSSACHRHSLRWNHGATSGRHGVRLVYRRYRLDRTRCGDTNFHSVRYGPHHRAIQFRRLRWPEPTYCRRASPPRGRHGRTICLQQPWPAMLGSHRGTHFPRWRRCQRRPMMTVMRGTSVEPISVIRIWTTWTVRRLTDSRMSWMGGFGNWSNPKFGNDTSRQLRLQKMAIRNRIDN